jgi:phosphate transport system substrate-binding protein
MKVSMLVKSAAVALAFGLVASTPAHAVDLQGSGASFPALLIEACKAPYAASGAGHTYVYASSSSGTGQKNSDQSIGDFWMSDSPYTAATKRASLIHIPVVAAPIAVLHNLPGRNTLALSASSVAAIFAGTITKWNDPILVKENTRTYDKAIYKKDANGTVALDAKGNPIILKTYKVKAGIALPNQKIKVIYRSESSGTSGNFTKYLNGSASSIWTKAGNNVFATSFPGDLNSIENLGRVVGAASSSGVTQLAGRTPYSITYAEVNYAVANKLKVASLINPAGNLVAPESIGVSGFLAAATQDATSGFLTFNYATKDKGAYPLGIVSYMLADTKYPSAEKAAAVKSVANFFLSTKCAQDKGADLGFSVIDGDLLKTSLSQVAKIG